MIPCVWLRDTSGQNLAQFLMPDDQQVIGIPMTGLFEAYRADITLPIWVPPGCLYSPEGFLRYLANVASWAKRPAEFTTASSRDGTTVLLTRQMQASDLARLTGYDTEKIRTLLREFLVFEDAEKPLAAGT